jgi:hypothetical protein
MTRGVRVVAGGLSDPCRVPATARTPVPSPRGPLIPRLHPSRDDGLIGRGSGAPNKLPTFQNTTDPDHLPYFVTIPFREQPSSKRLLQPA